MTKFICCTLLIVLMSCSLMRPQDDVEIFDLIKIKSSKNTEIDSSRGKNQHLLQASVWYKFSGEFRALFYQAFNSAKNNLSLYKAKNKTDKILAVVIDVDDTILNNIPYHEYLIKTGNKYPYLWKEWINKKKADLLPGVLSFINFCKKENIEIFYSSNRDKSHFKITLDNLEEAGLKIKKKNLLLNQVYASDWKKSNKIKSNNYEVVLYIGDNLNNLSDVFHQQNMTKRMSLVDLQSSEFGNKYIILPNPINGAWEDAIFQYKKDLTENKKNELKRSLLKGFKL